MKYYNIQLDNINASYISPVALTILTLVPSDVDPEPTSHVKRTCNHIHVDY